MLPFILPQILDIPLFPGVLLLRQLPNWVVTREGEKGGGVWRGNVLNLKKNVFFKNVLSA